MARYTKWVPVGLAAILVLTIVAKVVLPARKLQKAPGQVANVEVQTLKPQVYRESLLLPAKIVADHEAGLSSEVGGTLDEWLAAEGTPVTAGQVLARLNTDTLRAKLGELQAALGSGRHAAAVAAATLELAKVGLDQAKQGAATAELRRQAAVSSQELARKEFARAKDLAAKSILSQADLDRAADGQTQAEVGASQAAEGVRSANLGVESAKLQLTQAEANLQMGEARVKELEAGINSLTVTLGKAEIKAPFAGWLDQHLVKVGEMVGPGQRVAHLYDLGYVRVRMQVADRYVPFLGPPNPAVTRYISEVLPGARQDVHAKLILPGLPKLTGERTEIGSLPADIAMVAQAADGASNTFDVELRLANPGGALKHGILAQGQIDYLVYDAALVIPLAAIRVTDEGPRCLVVEERDGKWHARIRAIAPKSIHENLVLVTAGQLAAGDRLIVSGIKGLVDNQEVNIVKQDGKVLTAPPAEAAAATAAR
jgi:RND family efflux transporter MFP subunit